MDLTPRELADETDPLGLLEPVGPLGEIKKGKQAWRYRFPDQEYDLGRGTVADPAMQQAGPNDSPFDWVVAEIEVLKGVDIDVNNGDVTGSRAPIVTNELE